MSGLFDSLSSATSGLTAARLGLDVAGQNLANINTVGYSRRTLVLAEQPATDQLSAGRGVNVVGVQAQRDVFVDARLRTETQGNAFDSAMLDGLTEVESAVGLPGQSLDAQLGAFFDAFSTLSDDPTSASAREDVVLQAGQLAEGFHTLTDRLTTTRRDADLAVGAAVEEVNQLAAQVAQLNEQISTNGGDVESLRDSRDVAVSRLSELAGVTVTTGTGGSVNLSIGSGRPLVVGTSVYTVTGTPDSNGFTRLSTGGFDVTSEITGGRIGGLMNLRDTVVPGYQARLDQLASDVATSVNAVHNGGFDANGAAGGDFFTPPSGVAGAAGALAVDPDVAADSGLVAASGTGAVGDNTTARAIAALRNSRVANGGTATASDAWGQLVYRVGADVSSAQASSDAHSDVVQQLQQLRDQTSGVSMDEEAANLMRYQRAYEASARYFTTINTTLETLMSMVQL